MMNEPELKEISPVRLTPFSVEHLPNGVPLYLLPMGERNVCRLDIVFKNGVWSQTSPLQATVTGEMLREGCANKSSYKIAEELDFYGASFQVMTDYHSVSITLFTLVKYSTQMFGWVAELLQYADFPQKEFSLMMERKLNQFLVAQQKVETIASKAARQFYFSPSHPYGRHAEQEDYSRLNREMLFQYKDQFYRLSNGFIFLSGDFSDKEISLVSSLFGKDTLADPPSVEKAIPFSGTQQQERWIEKGDALQSSVRWMGPALNRTDDDFFAYKLTDMLLGGYFGSRLMKNIREDKGYTYGIGSYVINARFADNHVIAAQTDPKNVSLLQQEIVKEMELLHQCAPSDKELDMVKRYIKGELIRSVDSPFALAQLYIDYLKEEIPLSLWDGFWQTLPLITPEKVSQTARLYYKPELYVKIIAGSKE